MPLNANVALLSLSRQTPRQTAAREKKGQFAASYRRAIDETYYQEPQMGGEPDREPMHSHANIARRDIAPWPFCPLRIANAGSRLLKYLNIMPVWWTIYPFIDERGFDPMPGTNRGCVLLFLSDIVVEKCVFGLSVTYHLRLDLCISIDCLDWYWRVASDF